MKQNLIFFLLISIFFSCNNKTLELPQVAVLGISEIQNHSQIWVFYNHNKDEIKADLNKNNSINSTHWIINIDKRLPLSEVIPVFQIIKNKRAKKSIHSVEGMHNYLSYSDMSNKQISLFPMDSIQYIMQSKTAVEKLEKVKTSKYILEFSSETISINRKIISPNEWHSSSLDTLSKGRIQLHFDSQITYQEYMQYRLPIDSMLPKDVKLERIEYIIK